MTRTRSNGITEPEWDIPFWFAVLSPVLGILTGILALLFFFR
jgi:hypothetical protein